jgi:hypothetical protein
MSETATEMDEDELLQVLDERCQMDTSVLDRALYVDFGRWFMDRYPINYWSLSLAESMWVIWQTQKRSRKIEEKRRLA